VTAPSLTAPGIWRIELPTPWPPVGPVNAYLIDDEPLTLVDTGPLWGVTLKALEDSLATIGYRVDDLGRVIVTHQHLDHFGLAQTLVGRSGAELYALDAVVDWFASYPTSIASEDDFAVRVLSRHGASEQALAVMMEENIAIRAFGAVARITHPVTEGDVLEFAGRTLKVMHRPGHSPSDTLFHDAEHGTLLGGDHLLNHRRSIPVMAPPLNGSEVHVRPRAFVQYLESLKATRAMELECVLPGHGDPITDHQALIDDRLRRNDRATDKVAALLTSDLVTASDLALAIRGGEDVSFFALCEVLGHLDRLLDQGVAIEDDGPIKRFARRT
jgi:glyoxylase-like metal-dependent hydrolase (beta-lactamase superfamily II)